jgi:hypothetical protein
MAKTLYALATILLGITIIFLALASRHAKVTHQAFLTTENLIGTLPLFLVAAALFVLVTIGVIFGQRKDPTIEDRENAASWKNDEP